ncbi:hypothetical protein NQ314_018578 [Rhamnusium bicolor]|uniref:Uncharacterized protein n=1 Tax=Rhamnusium bicolor TaxID=1586634 RepID=A0AAV8WRJ4_9CUCU|nr:hypothetical protein NQ314_018578 [Rhamnusium bicolor]
MQVTLYLTIIFIVGVFCEDTYTSKYDNIDIDSIIKNDRLLKNYIDCLLDKGKCGPDAAELKSE